MYQCFQSLSRYIGRMDANGCQFWQSSSCGPVNSAIAPSAGPLSYTSRGYCVHICCWGPYCRPMKSMTSREHKKMHQNTIHHRHLLLRRHPHLPMTHDAGEYPEQSAADNAVLLSPVMQRPCTVSTDTPCTLHAKAPWALNPLQQVHVRQIVLHGAVKGLDVVSCRPYPQKERLTPSNDGPL